MGSILLSELHPDCGGMMSTQCDRSLYGTTRKVVSFNIDFSPDGKLVILVTKQATINVMDVASGECVLEIEEQSRLVD